jgi:YbbR domain-containing protein
MRFFTENLAAKLFSILMAALLWVAVVDEQELIETVTVPVEYRNLGNDLDLSPDAPSRIQLQVRGPRGRLNDVSPDKTNIVLDLAGMNEPSARTFTIQAEAINLPPAVTLVRAMPSQLRVTLERRVYKDLPVVVNYEDRELASRIISTQIEPPLVRVVGPQSRIDRTSMLSTEPINLKQLGDAQSVRVNVLLTDPELSVVGSPLVTVRLNRASLP